MVNGQSLTRKKKRPDRLVAGDVWQFSLDIVPKGKRRPVPTLLRWKVIGWHWGQYAWHLQSIDGEHDCYLLEFAPQYESMKYLGSLPDESPAT